MFAAGSGVGRVGYFGFARAANGGSNVEDMQDYKRLRYAAKACARRAGWRTRAEMKHGRRPRGNESEVLDRAGALF